MVTEGLVLSLTGGWIGVALAPAGMKALERLVPRGLAASAAPTLDGRVLLFTFVLSAVRGIAVQSGAGASGSAGIVERGAEARRTNRNRRPEPARAGCAGGG